MAFNNKTENGQSLLEMVFAIGILLMVTSAILALSMSNLAGEKESEQQVIANNFAREAIEAVRNIRDANWLAKADWDSGLIGANKARANFNPGNVPFWTISFFPAGEPDSSFLLYQSGTGFYNHDASGQPTIFYRHLFADGICQDKTAGSEVVRNICNANEQKVGIKVQAIVTWKESNRTRQVTLEDLLYAWK